MNDTPKTDVMMKFCFGTDQEYIRLVDAIKLERELNAAKSKIKRLEKAGDAMAIYAKLGGIPLQFVGVVNAWIEAKEDEP